VVILMNIGNYLSNSPTDKNRESCLSPVPILVPILNLITQSGGGELFVIRNAGNIIPPYGATNGGEAASIEYAINALGIEQVIICGHSHCGAIKGLLKL
jgi:pimeloyl-ACP methyl ester carboxylesterase